MKVAAMFEDDSEKRGSKPRPSSAAGGLAAIRLWPSRAKGFLGDVRSEAKRVAWPSLTQIRGTTVVVILTVFFFGVYFGILDWLFNNAIRWVLRIGS